MISWSEAAIATNITGKLMSAPNEKEFVSYQFILIHGGLLMTAP